MLREPKVVCFLVGFAWNRLDVFVALFFPFQDNQQRGGRLFFGSNLDQTRGSQDPARFLK